MSIVRRKLDDSPGENTASPGESQDELLPDPDKTRRKAGQA